MSNQLQDEAQARMQPKIAASVHTLINEQLRADIDSYIEKRTPVAFLRDLPSKLLLQQPQPVLAEHQQPDGSSQPQVAQIRRLALI